ncbi:MAG: cyclic nucleotide-binding domain-containing protein [Bacteroidia bacterium]|nr:cyclic nucleotide-binding domain-containing protein [Bacteroidia bacterium]
MYTNLEAHIASFVKLGEPEFEILRASLKTAELRKKELLFREGGVCRADYFVDKGCLRMFFIDDKSTERTTQFAIENWWMADYISLERQTASDFSLHAVVASQVLVLERNAFEKLLAAVPAHYPAAGLCRFATAHEVHVRFFGRGNVPAFQPFLPWFYSALCVVLDP